MCLSSRSNHLIRAETGSKPKATDKTTKVKNGLENMIKMRRLCKTELKVVENYALGVVKRMKRTSIDTRSQKE